MALDPEKYISTTMQFLDQGVDEVTDVDVTGFILKEDISNIPPIRPWAFMGTYPTIPGKELFLSYTMDRLKPPSIFKNRALRAEIPDRVRRAPSRLIWVNSGEVVESLTNSHMFSRLLVIGEEVETNHDTLILYCVRGIQPDVALNQIQQFLTDTIGRSN